MSKKKKQTTTTTQAPDAASQQYINQLRSMGQGAAQTALGGPAGGGSWFTGPLQQTPGEMADAFMSPYMDNVVNAVRGEFDHMRGQANMATNQAATQAGAFGGSRHGVAQGVQQAGIDRAQASQISDLMNSGYQTALGQGMQFAEHQRQLQERQLQEPLFRQQMAMNFQNQGMGPVGTQTATTQQQRGNALGSMLGGALSGFGVGGPWGALIGAGAGLLG